MKEKEEKTVKVRLDVPVRLTRFFDNDNRNYEIWFAELFEEECAWGDTQEEAIQNLSNIVEKCE